MRQNEGWRVKSKKIQIVPESEDAKHSLIEQEAKGRQQSHTPVKTVHEISLWLQLKQDQQALHCSWRSPKSHLCLPGQK